MVGRPRLQWRPAARGRGRSHQRRRRYSHERRGRRACDGALAARRGAGGGVRLLRRPGADDCHPRGKPPVARGVPKPDAAHTHRPGVGGPQAPRLRYHRRRARRACNPVPRRCHNQPRQLQQRDGWRASGGRHRVPSPAPRPRQLRARDGRRARSCRYRLPQPPASQPARLHEGDGQRAQGGRRRLPQPPAPRPRRLPARERQRARGRGAPTSSTSTSAAASA